MTLVTHTYTTTQDITLPSWVTHVDIEMKAGGGGGAGGSISSNACGGGGGEGEVKTASKVAVSPGAHAIIVGAGGLGGALSSPVGRPGGAGGDSSAFGVTAAGGAGGDPYVGTSPTKGAGTGGGAAGSVDTGGSDATGYGCGGGGSGYYISHALITGGDGSGGYVTISYYEPDITFSATPTEDTAPSTIAFTASATESPTAWYWTFGDGGTSTSQNPTREYATPGKYTVSLTVTNAYGSFTSTKTDYIAMCWEPTTQAYFLMADPRGP